MSKKYLICSAAAIILESAACCKPILWDFLVWNSHPSQSETRKSQDSLQMVNRSHCLTGRNILGNKMSYREPERPALCFYAFFFPSSSSFLLRILEIIGCFLVDCWFCECLETSLEAKILTGLEAHSLAAIITHKPYREGWLTAVCCICQGWVYHTKEWVTGDFSFLSFLTQRE